MLEESEQASAPGAVVRKTSLRFRVNLALLLVAALELVLALVSSTYADFSALVAIPISTLALCGVGASISVAVTEHGRGKNVVICPLLLQLCLLLSSLYFQLLIRNVGESKLYRLGVDGLSLESLFSGGFSSLATALAIGTVATCLYGQVSDSAEIQAFNRTTYFFLASVGLIGLALRLSVSRSEAFAGRGEGSGEGLLNLLFWAAPVAVGYGILGRHGRARPLALISIIITVGIFVDGNRSPLLLILMAFILRLYWSLTISKVPIALISAAFGLFVFSLQSTWRGLARDDSSATFFQAIGVMAENPQRTVLRSGFDTLEGTGLTGYLLELGYRPTWWDPAVAVLNFVPRAIWSQKPTLFGSEIGVNVLGFEGAGGIFLSGPGYLLLWTGDEWLALVVFSLLAALASYLCRVGRDQMYVLISAATFLRFVLAGDPFDLFLGLQAAAIYWAASYAVAKSSSRRSIAYRHT